MGCDIHEHYEVKNEAGKWERLITRREELRDSLYGHNSDQEDEHRTQEEWDAMLNEMWEQPLYIRRNYGLFAILADVRNGRGFAGILTGSGFEPISEPRGLPDGLSQEVLKENATSHDPDDESYEEWTQQARSWVDKGYSTILQEEPLLVSCPDWHSHSWYTLKELLDYDWDAKTTTRRGVVCQSAYATWDRDKPGFPDSMSRMVSGAFVEHISEEEMQRRIKEGLPDAETAKREVNGEEMEGNVRFFCEVNFEMRYSDCCRHFVDKSLPFLKQYADEHLGGDYERLRFVFWFDN